MATNDDMMQEFAHLQEELERQRAQQRAAQRLDQGGEAGTREDRARRSGADRPGSPSSSGVVFAEGNKVLHDLLGEAVVRKLARDDDPDQKINIEWSRPGKSKKAPLVLHNRWVLPSSLKKLWQAPHQKDDASQQQGNAGQQGLFGAMPDLAAHEHERAAKMKPPVGPRGRQIERRTTKETKVSCASSEAVALQILEIPHDIDLVGQAGPAGGSLSSHLLDERMGTRVELKNPSPSIIHASTSSSQEFKTCK
eukprot:CAMPEP_0181198942 /NCGR_PEP_ID=MMETSP1096-20121128/16904_1 /TAXON_ID=156174 ORGANISM="Chrysochromulina ericina, Strain CCMP281" /NCGR_SAMPLE_ID=MMETSP1096 /ASSEMBLY_ACC=CAM_ASM_000453 /LENGTH=251 /DNA_ID=CAMNT_0023289075 /DNA_START=179 /DNA_END=931 /DNA_ORIENTATION=+